MTTADQVTDQVAAFNQMVEKKDAIIVYEPLSSSAFTTAASNAAAAGILSISVLISVLNVNVAAVQIIFGGLILATVALYGRERMLRDRV